MEARDVAERARTLAVMVRVQGPDPKGLKMRGRAFHLRENGITTLSASGLLLPSSLADSLPLFRGQKEHGALVVTTASAVEPFLAAKHRVPALTGPPSSMQSRTLIPGAAIDVLLDRGFERKPESSPSWHGAQLISIVDVAASSAALRSLVRSGIDSSDHGAWEMGWMLAAGFNALERETAMSAQVAFLRVPEINPKDFPPVNASQEQRRGDFLLAMGSPFGVLSPSHFLNSVSIGAVANVCCLNSCGSLLVADIRCLPGMEGGPVLGQDKSLVGILSRPVKQKNSDVEIQIIITWDSICASCATEEVDQKSMIGLNISSESVVEKAASSIVLITMGDEAWASGIVMNEHGLVLTNAHLLEPWRFRRHSLLESGKEELGFSYSQELPPRNTNALLSSGFKGYNRIRVRINHKEPFIWSDADVVYVSKGPLDVALLQLNFIPQKLCLVVPDFDCPSEGSRVHAIGHGPFGPHSEVCPFVSSGVVTKVVETNPSGREHLPVMLQTTAAVYPGMSGGAIVNTLNGEMVGLITSNVRHAGGNTIPHLNFSLPCAALKPVFDFAVNKADRSVLNILDKPDALLSSIWALVPPPSPTPKVLLPHAGLKGKDGKGSRFAQFLAERQGEGAVSGDSKRHIRGKVFSKL